MRNSTKKNYSIGDTAKMTGVTQKQIRNWEAKGYIPEATRVVSGERHTADSARIRSKSFTKMIGAVS